MQRIYLASFFASIMNKRKFINSWLDDVRLCNQPTFVANL